MTAPPTPVLWICGPSGVGKSSVGWQIFSDVTGSGIAAGYLDFDQIGFCRPAPAGDDLENHGFKARNLAALWPQFAAAGARCLVVSGIVTRHQDIARYVTAIPNSAVTVCRLRCSADQLRQRILLRGRGGGPPIPGDELVGRSEGWLMAAADDSIREGAEMEGDGIGDIVVDTDELLITEVAGHVRAAAGAWPALR